TITIERGSGLNTIAARLEEIGAVSNRYLFIGGVRVMGAQGDLKAGEYALPAGITAKAIAEKLRDHDIIGRFVTVREGLTSFEVARLLNGFEGLSGEIAATPPEGSLLPETYDYQLNEARSKIIIRMSQAMEEAIAELWPQRAENLPFDTIEEAITLASIIEKETAKADERRTVAGVFINRLRKGMPLQTDPTVIYAITKGQHKNDGKGPLGRRLLRKDLAYDSPYNTYKYSGLPPGPIANPGKASIAAALNPAAHDYIYFVADGTGGHAFAKTLKEHNANAAKWRKIRSQR
ncbi:MAG: endolytic transglycosylase MltG, partial [Alphaproteobacteria bacterium]